MAPRCLRWLADGATGALFAQPCSDNQSYSCQSAKPIDDSLVRDPAAKRKTAKCKIRRLWLEEPQLDRFEARSAGQLANCSRAIHSVPCGPRLVSSRWHRSRPIG